MNDELKEEPVESFEDEEVYKKYVDLEDENKVVRVPLANIENFEKSYSIIYSKFTNLYESEYYDLQRKFFMTSVKDTQESAISLVLSK